jgi:hypothetical protein
MLFAKPNEVGPGKRRGRGEGDGPSSMHLFNHGFEKSLLKKKLKN